MPPHLPVLDGGGRQLVALVLLQPGRLAGQLALPCVLYAPLLLQRGGGTAAVPL